jgi:hypothetical protein
MSETKRPIPPRQRQSHQRAEQRHRTLMLEREQPTTTSYEDADGNTRVRVGQLDDGTWGWVVYQSDGSVGQKVSFP